VRELLVERLAIPQAAFQKLRPVRHDRQGVRLLWQQSPERRMMPTQLMPCAVPMSADAVPESLHLGDQLFARHAIDVVVHDASVHQRAALKAAAP
jgi:hypothetical protein